MRARVGEEGQARRVEKGGLRRASPSFHAARACNKHREGQFDAGEQANPTREPSRASPRRGNRHRSPNRPEYACASDGGGVGGYRGLQRCSGSGSSPPVHPRHLATRRRGQRGGAECSKRVRIAQNAGEHSSAGSIRSFYTNVPTRWTTSPRGRRTRPPNLLWHGRESRQSIFFLSTFFV